jgi:hypothetical protein
MQAKHLPMIMPPKQHDKKHPGNRQELLAKHKHWIPSNNPWNMAHADARDAGPKANSELRFVASCV